MNTRDIHTHRGPTHTHTQETHKGHTHIHKTHFLLTYCDLMIKNILNNVHYFTCVIIKLIMTHRGHAYTHTHTHTL